MKTIEILTREDIIKISKKEIDLRIISIERELDKLRRKINDLENIRK